MSPAYYYHHPGIEMKVMHREQITVFALCSPMSTSYLLFFKNDRGK